MRIFGLALVVGALIAGPTQAQSTVAVPDDAKFVVQLNVAAFANTELGGKVLELTQKMASEEIGSEDKDVMETVEETLGFNPLEELQTLTIVGSDYESPEEGLRVVLQMKKTTGNLEGMMLGLPGYESYEKEGHTIHTASEDDMAAFASIQEDKSGNKRVVIATSESKLMDLLTEQETRIQRQVSWTVPDGTFAQLQVIQFPEDLMDVDQAKNVVKLLENVSVFLGEDGSDFTADVALTATNEKKAEQIEQLVLGVKAMVGLFQDEIGDDEDAKMAMEILDQVSIDREGRTLTVHGSLPEEMMLKFLREEADLPL